MQHILTENLSRLKIVIPLRIVDFSRYVPVHSLIIFVFIILGLRSYDQLRPHWTPHDVRLKDGTHFRQGTFLRLRPCLLWQNRHWTKGKYPLFCYQRSLFSSVTSVVEFCGRESTGA